MTYNCIYQTTHFSQILIFYSESSQKTRHLAHIMPWLLLKSLALRHLLDSPKHSRPTDHRAQWDAVLDVGMLDH
jgi:hypothetical protein